MVVHEHGHPHVLLLQTGANAFRLPGGRLRAGEEETAGLVRKLERHLGPEAGAAKTAWRVGDLLATWYRPGFEATMYPYCPPHIVRPKEVKRLYLCPLPETRLFAVPTNRRLIAVPLFELYDHASRYGAIPAACPEVLSRYALTFADRDGSLRPAPGVAPPALQGAGGETADQGLWEEQQLQQQKRQKTQDGGDDDEGGGRNRGEGEGEGAAAAASASAPREGATAMDADESGGHRHPIAAEDDDNADAAAAVAPPAGGAQGGDAGLSFDFEDDDE